MLLGYLLNWVLDVVSVVLKGSQGASLGINLGITFERCSSDSNPTSNRALQYLEDRMEGWQRLREYVVFFL